MDNNNGDINKKRKVQADSEVVGVAVEGEECYKFNFDDPVDMITKLVHSQFIAVLSTATIKPPLSLPPTQKEKGTSTTDKSNTGTGGEQVDFVKNRIVELKYQIDLLLKAKECIDSCTYKLVDELKKRKQEEISDLFDTYSPLLSLGYPILSQVMEYCDKESLYCCEKASHSLADIIEKDNNWLKNKSGFFDSDVSRLTDLDLPPRDPHFTRFGLVRSNNGRMAGQSRGFGELASKAGQIESAGERHYNYKQILFSDQLSEDLEINCQGCSNFPTIHMDALATRQVARADYNTFVRVSRWDQEGQRHYPVWQGLARWDVRRRGWNYLGQFRISTKEQFRWPQWDDFWSWLENNPEMANTAERRIRFKSLLETIRITLVKCGNWVKCRNSPQYLLTTGGYCMVDGTNVAEMHPRVGIRWFWTDGDHDYDDTTHVTSLSDARDHDDKFLIRTQLSCSRDSMTVGIYFEFHSIVDEFQSDSDRAQFRVGDDSYGQDYDSL